MAINKTTPHIRTAMQSSHNSGTDKCTYIVTGATGGLGRELVRELTKEANVRIIMAVRNVAAAQKLAESLADSGAEFHAMHLDLCSLASVDAFCSAIREKGWKISGLINNAGMMPGDVRVTEDGHECATQVNYVATKRLTEQLKNLVEPGGAIVFTTSITRKITRCRSDWDEHAKTFRGIGRRFITYGRSKRMIAAYAHQLADQLADKNIRVNCGDPGIADTGMITMGIRWIDALTPLIFRPFINTASQGAQGSMRALRSPLSGQIFTPQSKSVNNY